MNPTNQTLHRLSLCLMAAYLVALALIVFWPTPVDRPAAGILNHFIAWMHHHGVPKFLGYNTIEFSANIIMFVPMGIIASVWTKRAWAGVLVGFAASVLIETCQGLFLAQRYASALDVLANTLGAVVGAVVYLLAHERHRRRISMLPTEQKQRSE
ncbi:VanZ family protein [Arthrobacter sp. LAPM80]|uniref:VanZ family protein n=1 Tax=Arthrobacter sp. LAPM80 TaxID=3141788 RepID=UPI00398B7C09